jgi:hypothetical protein
MRYMFIVKGDENMDRSGPPAPALMEAIDKLIREETASGKLVSFGGLRHTSEGGRVRSKGGKLTTTDGPFTEAKEVIGGFSIYELGSKAEAMAEAEKFMELHRRHWPEWEGVCEVRRMFDGSADDPF